jgi:hypothetical protein
MKALICASVFFFGVLAGPLQAAQKSIFTEISETAPLSGVFEDLSLTAPKSIFDSLNETAPRSDGVFGELEKTAP